jgi:hypothetical protein
MSLHAEDSKSAKRFKNRLAEAPDDTRNGGEDASEEVEPAASAAAPATTATPEYFDIAGGWNFDPPSAAAPLSAEAWNTPPLSRSIC